MGVSRSGYYAWKGRPRSARQREGEQLLAHIRGAFEQSRATYGSPRIHRELGERGVACGEGRVARLMRQNGIRVQPVRRFRATTDSAHALPVAANLLERDFTAEGADRRWAADITYLWTREGWLYLAVVLDLFSRRVVGWSIRPTLERGLVIGALEAALSRRRPAAGLIHHSDRGSQYASGEFQLALSRAGIVCSMSRKGNCWDNAAVESFFGTLKREAVRGRPFASREEARSVVFEYIEVWYNRKRRHSSLGYLSPEQFERRAAAKLA
jgi:transposase InsO family protein